MRVTVTFVLLALFASASDLEAPRRGLVVSGQPPSLRPLVGVAGASILGQAIGTGRVRALAGRYAIVEREDGLFVLDTRDASAKRLDIAPSSEVELSPEGRAGAFYTKDSVRIVTGLPAGPAISEAMTLPESAASVFVADDGRTVVSRTSAGDLYLLEAGAAPRKLPVAAVSLFRFVPSSSAAFVLAGDRAFLLESTANGSMRLLSVLPAAPVEAAVSADGRSALVSFRQSASWINLGDGSVTELSIRGELNRPIPFGSSGFSASAGNSPGVWLFEPEREAVYVPPAPIEEPSSPRSN